MLKFCILYCQIHLESHLRNLSILLSRQLQYLCTVSDFWAENAVEASPFKAVSQVTVTAVLLVMVVYVIVADQIKISRVLSSRYSVRRRHQ